MNRTNCGWLNRPLGCARGDGCMDLAGSAVRNGDVDAAGAEVGVVRVGAYAGPVVPAALAFGIGAFLGRDGCLAGGLL